MYSELCATDLFGVFGFGAFRPRIGVFWWTAPPSNPVPSTLGAVFVDRKDEETMFVAPDIVRLTLCKVLLLLK